MLLLVLLRMLVDACVCCVLYCVLLFVICFFILCACLVFGFCFVGVVVGCVLLCGWLLVVVDDVLVLFGGWC